MSENSLEVLRCQLNDRSAFGIFHVEDIIPLIAERDAAWARYAEARADYADETMCGDPRRVTAECDAAREALVKLGVDPELLG